MDGVSRGSFPWKPVMRHTYAPEEVCDLMASRGGCSRRMWSVDHYYGWQTERMCLAVLPAWRAGGPQNVHILWLFKACSRLISVFFFCAGRMPETDCHNFDGLVILGSESFTRFAIYNTAVSQVVCEFVYSLLVVCLARQLGCNSRLVQVYSLCCLRRYWQ